MRRNAGLIVAAVIAVAALVGMIVIVGRRGSHSNARFAFSATTPAAAPFADFREARVAIGGRCLRVLVASTSDQRVQGLRDVRTLAPYDGMVFVYGSDADAQFTMASTPVPLDMTWYGADGTPVDHTEMTPCPNGTDGTCPQYASKHAYRYAVERPAGSSGSGALGACAS